MRQIVFVQLAYLREMIQRDGLPEVRVDVPLDRGAFPGCPLRGRDGKLLWVRAPEKHQKGFKRVAAQLLVVRQIVFEFREEQTQEKPNLTPALAAMKQAAAAPHSAAGGIHAKTFHPEGNVFHRSRPARPFRVIDFGVNHDQIILVKGIWFALRLKINFPAEDIEKFGVRMRMRRAAPLSFIFGRGGV